MADNAQRVRSPIASDFLGTVKGFGTAGTPDTGVITVQGISGGTALNIAGTQPAGTPGTVALTIQGISGGTPVPVTLAGGDADGLPVGATSIYTYGATTGLASAGTSANLITKTITALKTGYITKFRASATGLAKVTLQFDAVDKQIIRLSPSCQSVEYTFDPPLPAAAATVVNVDVNNPDPLAIDVEVSFDGYEV